MGSNAGIRQLPDISVGGHPKETSGLYQKLQQKTIDALHSQLPVTALQIIAKYSHQLVAQDTPQDQTLDFWDLEDNEPRPAATRQLND